MRKNIFVFGVTLLMAVGATTAWADQARYCIGFSAMSSDSQEVVSQAQCEVVQFLKWDDSRSLWKCWFDRRDSELPQVLVTTATLGYNYDLRAAFSIYQIGSTTPLGSFLIAGLGLPSIPNASEMKVTYFTRIPLTDRILVLESGSGIFELHVTKLEYARCDYSRR